MLEGPEAGAGEVFNIVYPHDFSSDLPAAIFSFDKKEKFGIMLALCPGGMPFRAENSILREVFYKCLTNKT